MSRSSWKKAEAQHAAANRRRRYQRLPPQITGVVKLPSAVQDILDSTGEHAGHEVSTVGLYTRCSCGGVVLGRGKTDDGND